MRILIYRGPLSEVILPDGRQFKRGDEVKVPDQVADTLANRGDFEEAKERKSPPATSRRRRTK